MTRYEILTLLISVLAIVISFYTLREQRKLQREANDLQRATDELARRQIREMEHAAAQRLQAGLEVELQRDRTSSNLLIANTSVADAFEVFLEFDLAPGVSNPLSSEDRERRLPIKRIAAGSFALLPCTIYYEHPPVLEGHLNWRNPDDSASREKFKVFT